MTTDLKIQRKDAKKINNLFWDNKLEFVSIRYFDFEDDNNDVTIRHDENFKEQAEKIFSANGLVKLDLAIKRFKENS